jgi:hypothetical protein
VIPREPYPGDIGSHSPFLRIGDRTTLGQHTPAQTHARPEDRPKFKFPTGIRATLSTTCGKQPRAADAVPACIDNRTLRRAEGTRNASSIGGDIRRDETRMSVRIVPPCGVSLVRRSRIMRGIPAIRGITFGVLRCRRVE